MKRLKEMEGKKDVRETGEYPLSKKKCGSLASG